MAISFSFKNNMQILKFSERLSQAEFAQVLLKLEEKIAQGRKDFLFQLEDFHNGDETAKTKMLQLLHFCLEKRVRLVLWLPNKYWLAYSNGIQAPTKMVSTEAEAIAYFNSHETLEKSVELTPNELKEKDTDELIKKYEIFHKADELDPHLLKKMHALYKQTPTLEALEHLEKAVIDIEKRKGNILRLEAQCEQISKQALAMSIARTSPIKEPEILIRKKELDERNTELLTQQQLYSQKISDLQNEIAKINFKIHKLNEKPLASTR